MSTDCCGRCGKALPAGALKYIVRIKLFADFDGELHHQECRETENIESLLSCIEDSIQEELEDDIYQEMAFLLCKDCREVFVRNPLSRTIRTGVKKGEFSGLLH